MIFKLSFLLTTLAITAAPLVTALPNAQGKQFEARDLLPRHGTHGNSLNARHMRRSYSSPKEVVKRSAHRKRRNCPAAVSSSPDSTVTTSTAPASTEGSSTPTTDSPASLAPSADPTQDAPSQDSPAPAPSQSNSDPSVQTYLDMHNNERSKHGASALTWADDLAAVAQSWANGCAFKHSGGQFGENLSAGSGTSVSPSAAVQMWLDEAPDYNPSNPQYSHWTQVVWKGTREVGCAVTTCSSESIFGTSAYGTAQFYVCEYRPAGNVIGQFDSNVQA